MTQPPVRTSNAIPQFLSLNGRRLFALQIEPTAACRGSVLYLPPYAEEMNRCRALAAAQARAWAAVGIRTLLLDPYGTGESEGQLADARWDLWVEDALAAGQWLEALAGQPIAVWGLRTGALLAADLAASGRLELPKLVFWQPVIDGKLFLNQYLRLRIASQVVSATERETTDQIRQRLAAGEILEVAGYPLGGALADGIAASRLGAGAWASTRRVAWLEAVAQADQPLSPASRRTIDALTAAGVSVGTAAVACPMVWQLHQRADAPALIQATLELFEP